MELWDTSFHLKTAIESDENTVYDADAFAEQILTELHKWWK